jgi:hypothetical protein
LSKKKPASVSDDVSKKSVPNKSTGVPIHKALVALLASGTHTYYEKSYMVAHLKACGYDVSNASVSYVMTAARKRGNICVFVPAVYGYTSKPSGDAVLRDIRKRRRVSNSWIQNIKALVAYAKKNWYSVTGCMSAKDAAALKQEIKYYRTVSKSNTETCTRYGLR